MSANTDLPICPTHLVPAIPELARDSSGEPFIRYGCLMCANDLGLPKDEVHIIGPTTLALIAEREARERAVAS